MSFSSLLIHEITITNPGAVTGSDRYGNPVLASSSFTSRARVQMGGGGARSGASEEDIIDRDTRVSRFKIFVPAGTNVSGLSTIVWEGRSLRVDGEPAPIDGMHGAHHIEFMAEEVLG